MPNIVLCEIKAWLLRNKRLQENLILSLVIFIITTTPFMLLSIKNHISTPGILRFLENLFAENSPIPILYSYFASISFAIIQGIYILGTSREIIYHSLTLPGCKYLYIDSRLWAMRMIAIPFGILNSLFCFLSGQMQLGSIAFTLFHNSITVWIFIFSSLSNIHYIDASKKSIFNFQGHGIFQIILTYILTGIGLFLFVIIESIWSDRIAFITLLIISLLALIFESAIKYLLSHKIEKVKYRIFKELFHECWNTEANFLIQ